ncbi:zinc finger protein 765-like isoform X2 [Pimephales promelas]|uniref:zinc finger protein 765-like isoform X2 n=1 Tax=Pimephales promelas TaxID=90988 RepID=UPI0019555F2A|nr:zinc finger protein 765-like isoform X2 [Pimephales promelas]
MTDVRALSVFQERVKSLFGSFLDVLLVEITEAYRESFADSMCLSHCDQCASNQLDSNDNKDSEVRVESEESQLLMRFQCSDTVTPLQLMHRESKQPEGEQNQSNTLKILNPYPVQVSSPILTAQINQDDIQIAIVENMMIQTTESINDNEKQTFLETPNIPVRKPEEGPPTVHHQPETSGKTEPEPEQVIKQENEDVAVTIEEKEELENGCRAETQVCQISGENTQAQLKPEDGELHEPVELDQSTSFQREDSCLHWNQSSFGVFGTVRSQIPQSHQERLEPLQKLDNCQMPNRSLMPQHRGCLRPCFVQLQKAEILQRTIGQPRQLHVCSICNKFFIYKRTLRRHKRFHTGEKPYSCSLCSKTFILRKTLRQHKKLHLRRPYSCTQCGKRFKHWRKLRIHWRSHAGESPFKCSLCGKCCKTLKSLDRHLAYVDHT